MTYDSTFDQTRLDQLAQQHLGGTDISGRILFFGEPEENRLDLATWLLQVDASAEALFAFEDLDGDEGPFRYPRWKYSLESADDWNVRLVINPKTTLEAAREMIRSLADWVEGMSQEEYSEYSARHSHGPVIAPPSDEDFAPPF